MRSLQFGLQLAAPIYRIYERCLLRQVQAFPVPRHIGLILDGNRRYGRHHNLSDPHDIYMAGANKLDELLDWCTELQIQSMTLWVFSTENLQTSIGAGRGNSVCSREEA